MQKTSASASAAIEAANLLTAAKKELDSIRNELRELKMNYEYQRGKNGELLRELRYWHDQWVKTPDGQRITNTARLLKEV